MKRLLSGSSVILLLLIAVWTLSAAAYAGSGYVHDPMENPKAAADIVEDPAAVYGYAPNPASPRMGAFSEYDWSDPAFVAEMRSQREEYHASVSELYRLKEDMEAEGRTAEEIARAVSARRNEIRLESYQDDPEGLEHLKESNLAAYGNENGGTPEFFYEKYGSWETVIERAFATNPGADACLGLYDIYYDTYSVNGGDAQPDREAPAAEPTQLPPAPTEPPSSADEPPAVSPGTGDDTTVAVWSVMGISLGAAVMSIAALCAKRRAD